MNVINNKLVGNWIDAQFSEFDTTKSAFLSNLSYRKSGYKKGYTESNIDRISRLIGNDIDLWCSYFEFPKTEDYSFFNYNISKSFSTKSAYHLQIIANGKAINFRYSTNVNEASFIFKSVLDPLSKINKGEQVHFYVFATEKERFIIDYNKVRSLVKDRNSYTKLGDDDVAFHIQTLISNNCIFDILKLDKCIDLVEGELLDYVTYETIKENNRVHNYKRYDKVKNYMIKMEGHVMNKNVLAKLSKGNLIIGNSNGKTKFFESKKEAHETLSKTYDITYRALSAQCDKFTKAFDEFKNGKSLPRTLPLLRIDLDIDYICIDADTFLDEKFNDFIKAIIDKKNGQKIRREKSSKSITNNIEEKAI